MRSLNDPSSTEKGAVNAPLTPKPRYLTVPTQEQAYWTISRAIELMVKQNHDQQFSYDREALIKMLNDAPAKQSGAVVQ